MLPKLAELVVRQAESVVKKPVDIALKAVHHPKFIRPVSASRSLPLLEVSHLQNARQASKIEVLSIPEEFSRFTGIKVKTKFW